MRMCTPSQILLGLGLGVRVRVRVRVRNPVGHHICHTNHSWNSVPEAQVDMQEHCLHMPFTGTAAAYKMFGHAHHLRVPQHGFSDLVSMAIAEQHSLRSNSQASIPSRSKLMVAVAHGHMLFSVVTSVPCPNPCCCNVHHQRFLLEVHRCPSMSLNRCD